MTTMPVTIQEPVQPPMPPSDWEAGGGGVGLSTGDVIRVFKQRIFLMGFIWIVVVGASIWLTYYLAKNYPLYKSGAAVMVSSPLPKAPLELGQPQVAVDIMDRFVADQIQAIKSETVFRDALMSANVQATSWWQDKPQKKRSELLQELKDDLKVGQVQETNYIAISFATHNRKDASIIVNTIVKIYLERMKSASRTQYSSELQDYRAEEERLLQNLQRVLKQKQTFLTSELGTPGMTQGLNVVGEQWRALAEAATALEMEKLLAKATYDNLMNTDRSQIAISPQMQLYIQQDPVVVNLNAAIMGLEHQKMILGTKFGENHRVIKLLNRQLDTYRKEMERVLQGKEQEIRDFQIDTAHTNYLNMLQAELAMSERVLEAESKQRDIDEGIERYNGLETEQRLLEEQYHQVREYINQLLLVMSDTRSQVRVQQMQDAVEPERRYFPKYEYNVPAGVLLGTLLAGGLALLLELIDTSIRTPRDIVRHAHVSILGTIPDVDDEEIPIDQIELAMHTAPRSMTAEAIRTIRTNLLLSSPSELQRSVLVTSAKPEEGRTTVAINLAIALAQSGRRVLLVDANFHRPCLPEFFPKISKEGFSNALLGQVELEKIVTSTDLPNLDVMGTGPIPPNPTELLAGAYLADILTRATSRYDQVIFDGPPVLLVTDALVLASAVDGLIMVCRAKETSRGVILRANEHLEQVNARIFGAVLNAAQVRRGGYFREQIRTFYDYQPEALLNADQAEVLPSGVDDEEE